MPEKFYHGCSPFCFLLLFACAILPSCSIFPGAPLVGRPSIWKHNERIEGIVLDLNTCRNGETLLYVGELETTDGLEMNEERSFTMKEEKRYKLNIDYGSCKPAGNANVVLSVYLLGEGSQYRYQTKTDENGKFTFAEQSSFHMSGYSDTEQNRAFSSNQWLMVTLPGHKPLRTSVGRGAGISAPEGEQKGLLLLILSEGSRQKKYEGLTFDK